MLHFCHSVEGLAKLGSRAAAGFTVPKLKGQKTPREIIIQNVILCRTVYVGVSFDRGNA